MGRETERERGTGGRTVAGDKQPGKQQSLNPPPSKTMTTGSGFVSWLQSTLIYF